MTQYWLAFIFMATVWGQQTGVDICITAANIPLCLQKHWAMCYELKGVIYDKLHLQLFVSFIHTR